MKRGKDPIGDWSIRAEAHHVSITVSRYEQRRSSRVVRQGRGTTRRAETTRKAPMKGIDVNTYEVDPKAVADAIVRRLLAGLTLKPN